MRNAPSPTSFCPWMSSATVNASTVRTGLREMGEVEGAVGPMMGRHLLAHHGLTPWEPARSVANCPPANASGWRP